MSISYATEICITSKIWSILSSIYSDRQMREKETLSR